MQKMGAWKILLFTFVLSCHFLSSSSANNYADMMHLAEDLLRNRINLDKIQEEMGSTLGETLKWFDKNNLEKVALGMTGQLSDAEVPIQANYITNMLGVDQTGVNSGNNPNSSSNSQMAKMFSDVIQNVTKSFMTLSLTCKVDLTRTVVGISQGESWAIDMLDAMGKIESGIKQGNRMLWGSYDECIEVKAIPANTSMELFTGQYCQLSASVNGLSTALGGAALLSFGICIPSSCSQQEMKIFLTPVIRIISQERLKPMDFKCQKQDLPLDTKAIVMTIICGIFSIIIILATIYDVAKTLGKLSYKSEKDKDQNKVPTSMVHSEKEGYNTSSISEPSTNVTDDKETENGYVRKTNGSIENGHLTTENAEGDKKESPELKVSNEKFTQLELSKMERIFLSFSAYTNAKKLLNTRQTSGALTSVNGIRFLTTSWVILGHSFTMGYIKNEVYILQKWTQRVSFQAIENALVSVDTFFTLSGLLVSYLMLKDMKKNSGPRHTNWFLFYFHRFWRLTPVYMMIIGIYTCLAPYLANGPSYIQEDNENCKKYWWTNLLYVNNLVYDDEHKYGCIAWTWYLANDMQFYVLSPLLVVPFFWHVGLGALSAIIFLAATLGATAGLGIKNQWPPSLFGGGKHFENVDKYFSDYYIVPWCRMGPYIVGAVTGYILYRTNGKCKINKFLNLILWAVFTTLACLVLFGLYDALSGNPLDQPLATLYLTTHRTVWGACVCWVIFACSTGNGGIINTILSWKAFIPLSRLTYCAYLIHPIVLSVYIGTNRQAPAFTEITYTFQFFGILVSSLAVAFILSVTLEAPMMGIEKTLLAKKKN